MKLQKLISQCTDALQEAAYEDYAPDCQPHHFGATVDTDDGYLDLWMTRRKDGHYSCEVVICHDIDHGRDSENLTEYLSEALDDCIDWDALGERYQDDTEDEWQAHGFRDAADYWRWKEGR